MAKAAKPKKEKKPKLKNNFFWGFNIKLISKDRGGEQAYYDIIHKMFIDDVRKSIGNDKAATMRSQSARSYTHNGREHKILYGQLTRYTLLEGSQWYNEATKQYEDPNLPKGIYPNGFDTQYVFIPAVHRFFIANNAKVSQNMAYNFLKEALTDVINPNEQFELSIMQSQDTIDAIIAAPLLKDLWVNVSVTNDDVGDKAQEAIDKLLKKNNVGKIEATIKPDATGTLNSNEELIRGLIELAKDNGEAIAHIVDAKGKRATIKTAETPEKINIPTEANDDVLKNIVSKMVERYKDDGAANQ